MGMLPDYTEQMPGGTGRLVIGACQEAIAAALANRVRTGLAALATAAAVATMVLVVSGLDGVARYARETGERSFGSDTFVIAQLATAQLSRRQLEERLARNPPIRRSDTRFLDRVAGDRVRYAPTAQRSAEVVAGNRAFENAAVNGTTFALPDIRVIDVAEGRFFAEVETTQAAQVAVIGADLADALFPSRSAIGQRVRMAGRAFEVIGTVARQGQAGGVSLDRYVYIPLGAFERAFGSPATLQVFARAPTGGDAAIAESRAYASMRARRQLAPGDADTFDIITPEAARTFVLQLATRISAAALPLSLMALLAAVVVVTNTVLVSVTQRTREIGIRRAVGAPRAQILAEVLAESVLTAVLGGLAGIAAAAALLAGASSAFGIALNPSWTTTMMAGAAAAATGLVAGYVPARMAAGLDVVAAMRTE
jgi:putative ABC transport system permease protein